MAMMLMMMMKLAVTDYLYITTFSILLAWITADFVTQSKSSEEGHIGFREKKAAMAEIAAVVCSIFISVLRLGFCIHGVWYLESLSIGYCSLTASWFLATLYAAYCGQRRRVNFNWPPVLVSWWILSGLLNLLSVSAFVFGFWTPTPSKSVEFASFPFSVFLCFGPLLKTSKKTDARLQHEESLLRIDESADSSARDGDYFSTAGTWSRLMFWWLNPVFERGCAGRLELSHVPAVPRSETAVSSSSSLREALRQQKPGLVSLPRAIIRAVWRPLALNAVFAGVNTLSSYLGPFLITNFVEFIAGEDSGHGGRRRVGYLLACVFFLAKTVESLTQRHWYFGARRIGVRVRAAVMVAIYDKCLLTKYSGEARTGKVINLLDVDVERIGDFFWYIQGIWLLPVQVSLALLVLYRNLGTAASFSALAATVLVMAGNTPLAKRQQMLHSRIMEAKDSRMKATAETLKCMRILKLHSWETAYLEKLLRLRDVERSRLRSYLRTCSLVAFLFWASPTLVSVVAFGVCILANTPLTPGTVLSALATFRILQEPIYNLPELVATTMQTKVSLDRIQDFIKEDAEYREQGRPRIAVETQDSDIAVEIEPGEYAWGTAAEDDSRLGKQTLRIAERIQIRRGEKVAVCGAVGSGKSSFLCSILGETRPAGGGAVRVRGSRAYVPQTAWIQTGDVRENVVFGREMEWRRYELVLGACALDKDVELWADGDSIAVGEWGVNLSGGQKQRIQVARAIYNDADVFLLDDPFSAVDARTGTHLFKECLMRLLSSKTVIYVTHQLEFVGAADLILVLRDGKVVQSGHYKALIEDGNGEFVRQLAAHNQTLTRISPPKDPNPSTPPKQERREAATCNAPAEQTPKLSERSNEEERESGRVKWNVYRTFATSAYGGAAVPFLLLCQVLFQGSQMGGSYWVAWAAAEGEGRVGRGMLIGIFALLSAGGSLFVLGRAMLLAEVAVETAQRLFAGMLTSVLRAPMAFFDGTPSSRVLNRSSTDQSTVDTDIPYRLAGLVFAVIQLLLIIILMSLVAWPVFILFTVIIAISIWYQNYYIHAARELARMVGIQKATILHHLSESISGAATIRCFNQEDRFSQKNHRLIDDYSRITFHNYATMEWLSVRINFLFNIVFFAMLTILVSMPRSATEPTIAGLAATYGLNLNVLQAWVIWNLCNVENKMISVERILQFSAIPSEAPPVIEHSRPARDWPSSGTIEFHELQVRYKPTLPMVLRGISCTFPGGKKIGLVGRTGSGKSTLIQALFRVVEPSLGWMAIDDVDICCIGLHDLRSRLSIIPQDPTLFQGTMRTNLDPLQQHGDSELWEALHKCRLGEIVKGEQGLLDAPVAEDGENWSVGQRQLVCLARVLLHRRRILVLDEATASVDTATDNLIQKTVREETGNCTVITVAHRIPTVVDSDLVLVLDEGRILELGSPGELLRDGSSAFSELVMEFLGRSKCSHSS